MQQKRKRRSTSSIILIIFIVIFIIGGIVLIVYPLLTDIPNLIEKGSTMAGWQLMKDKFAGKVQEGRNYSTTTKAAETTVTETAVLNETTELATQTSINGQETQSQNSTSTTKAADAAIVNNKENIKYNAGDIFPAKLTIPKINIEWITNEGSDVPDLKKGPGHIPQTPLPGEAGRCTLSGHRTTYGAPFNRIDELKKGDMIYLEALNGNKYFYQVTSFQIVKPTYVEILNGTDRKELLLTTCYPEYSAKERLVVIAELVTVFPLDLNLK
jgi:LPXTG-site transpeptidase (sortase) family protein